MRLLLLTLTLICAPFWLAVHAEQRVPASQAEITMGFTPVVKATAPSVVNIYARRVVERRRSPFANDPFFRDFFDRLESPRPRVQNSLGSGVVLSEDGLVVSNYHVVGEATEIRVVFNDRREVDATVVLADQESDLAILQLEESEGLTALPLRASDTVEVGELVLAIGNPFGVGQTVSSGIISGLARTGVMAGSSRSYFIQTDAAINPGNSGGALVDMAGQLVGINTSILTRSGGSNGIGFAIPADLVARFVEQARAGNDRFVRPWAGVNAQAVDPDVAESLGMPGPDGIILNSLHPDSPFRAAGLGQGDVILSANGLPVTTPPEMIYRMSVAGIGRTIALEVLQEGSISTVDVALIEAPDTPEREVLTFPDRSALSGLTLSNINPAVENELGLSGLPFPGVIVTRAQARSARFGLRPGDVLRAINGTTIETTRDVAALFADGPSAIAVEVSRNGRRLLLRARL